ncbi:ABC transporter ATP-binding protein [Umezawaea tangerina]|uniref:ABC-2 type transport system ATP-binding protein n=1 Tax=Umezawaea tangerina TaxID=84725 RepID=A0A2T0T735_9PSEU|nr:ABC transporter ATP-binding protein [Umezawaea tangerina]PRY41489.1 ABC-2 type transport system ATP-binding protein [Umezawaea tangerina]
MTATGLALRTDGVGKRYRKGWALRDCTLALPAGGVIALVGPNGAGKITLLRLVVGLPAPSTGTVEVLGRDATPHTLSRIGFLAQDHPLYKRFTVAETLRFGRARNLRFDQGLAKLGIPLDPRVGTLSGGQQAQVALALALAKRPDLLVLDEPVAGLDPLARHEFLQVLMGAVAEGGVTVLFSSHVVHELERVCDHLVVLDQGRVTLTERGVQRFGVYRPADRFWPFQLVEAALFVAVAAILIGVVVWRVRHRVI